MRKFAAGLAVVTATALPVVAFGPAPAAQAAPICESAEAHGTIVGMWVFGPYCVPYKDATFCQTETTGFLPYASTTVMVCVPAPLTANADPAGDA
ncbi:MAG: hypothetical protein QOF18_1504 [Frankiaceae bacterium]|jgi:hypothetical protein|nr:hypothetical protein [Frankiaceae bacterium]